MSDTVGLTVGVVALTSLFNTSVEWFEFVQVGRHHGIDFQTARLELDTCRLNLLRWGSAMGLTGTFSEACSLPDEVAESVEDIQLAQRILGQINTLFEEIDNASRSYQSSWSSDYATFSPAHDLDQSHIRLHQQMRGMAERRQAAMTWIKKMKWAVHGKSNVDKLLKDIKSLTEALTMTFSASKPEQRRLAQFEVEEVQDEMLPQLQTASNECDPILNEAVEKEMEAWPSYQNRKFEVLNGANALNGHWVDNAYHGPTIPVDYTFEDWKAVGEGSKVFNGTKYGGKDFCLKSSFTQPCFLYRFLFSYTAKLPRLCFG